jgi:hypothetical protein
MTTDERVAVANEIKRKRSREDGNN